MFCALFVFFLNYQVEVLCTICFILSLIRWCFAHYLFSTFTIKLVFCALFVFYSFIRGFFAHYLFSTFTITLVFCALFVFYFNYEVGVLRTICFILSLKVGVLGTICFLLLLIRYCFVHYLFCTFINTLVFSALFVLYFNYYVDVLRTICFLFELLG